MEVVRYYSLLAFCYMLKYGRKTAIPGLKSRNGRPQDGT